MLQRIQTIFLLCVTICMVALLFLPIWQKGSLQQDQTELVTLNAFQQVHTTLDGSGNNDESAIESKKSTFFIAVLALLAGGVALFSIFQYKNRLTQMKLGALNSLLLAGCMGLSLYYAMQAEKLLLPDMQGQYKLGFFMPVAALLFNLMANRFIRKDEKLVKSVDRIR